MKYSKLSLAFAILTVGAAAAPPIVRPDGDRGTYVVCYDPRDPRVPLLQNEPHVNKWTDEETGNLCFALAAGVQGNPVEACKGPKADMYPDHILCLAAGHKHPSKGDSCEVTKQARIRKNLEALAAIKGP
ncbi:uncharacterized protein PgNI_04885 [Pyricularia grisea]|uniref:Uncharacterized protein n=1 Tax=Pyricularia grisea TaxID=148305 RepID=A0A6P8BEA5_PYRGI|nr:uncharacterized protein PgNI_04885 [Pyricularia grisea]TLD14211.1 hypothetical protein PgNI_04885 [Pyricularia grisea]